MHCSHNNCGILKPTSCYVFLNYILLDLSVSTEHPYVALGPCCSHAHSFEENILLRVLHWSTEDSSKVLHSVLFHVHFKCRLKPTIDRDIAFKEAYIPRLLHKQIYSHVHYRQNAM